MIRIFDIASKDLVQILRDRRAFLFLLVMPIAFTFLFGFAFGAFTKAVSDPRLPVGFLDQDHTWFSRSLLDQLALSEVVRPSLAPDSTQASLEAQVAGEKLAAAIIVPPGYSHAILNGKPARLILIADTGGSSGITVESEALATAIRMENAVRTASIMEQVVGQPDSFGYSFDQALSKWKKPPISVSEITSSAIKGQDSGMQSMAHTSPGMMLQFSIASLLTAAQILVTERKSRCLQRLLTTAAHRVHILVGHFLAIFVLIFGQFLLLTSFGQFALGVNYLSAPAASLLVAFCAAFGISVLGLFIGIIARSEEQAIILSLVLMFLLSGMGGAWVPLEVTSATFQAIGHLSPVAWAMDGFKNITIRGWGFASVLGPCAALVGYGVLFFALATWRFAVAEEKV